MLKEIKIQDDLFLFIEYEPQIQGESVLIELITKGNSGYIDSVIDSYVFDLSIIEKESE